MVIVPDFISLLFPYSLLEFPLLLSVFFYSIPLSVPLFVPINRINIILIFSFSHCFFYLPLLFTLSLITFPSHSFYISLYRLTSLVTTYFPLSHLILSPHTSLSSLITSLSFITSRFILFFPHSPPVGSNLPFNLTFFPSFPSHFCRISLSTFTHHILSHTSLSPLFHLTLCWNNLTRIAVL